MMRRVVVTGMGLVTPLGSGGEHTWERLIKGESGIRSIQSFDVSDLPCKIGGQVPIGDGATGGFDAGLYIQPKDQRKMDPFIVYAMGAAAQAGEGSGAQPTAGEAR